MLSVARSDRRVNEFEDASTARSRRRFAGPAKVPIGTEIEAPNGRLGRRRDAPLDPHQHRVARHGSRRSDAGSDDAVLRRRQWRAWPVRHIRRSGTAERGANEEEARQHHRPRMGPERRVTGSEGREERERHRCHRRRPQEFVSRSVLGRDARSGTSDRHRDARRGEKAWPTPRLAMRRAGQPSRGVAG